MNKTTKWYAKPLYAVMALALVAGLMMVPAVVPGTSPIVEAAVSNVTVTVDPNEVNVTGNYTIAFHIITGLVGTVDNIVVTFPNDTAVPASYDTGDITVQGVNASNVSILVTDRAVTITVPGPLSGGTNVTVNFTAGASITNPTTGGNYTLTVSTSKETTAVPSAEYMIVGIPVVTSVSPAQAAQGATLNITITGDMFEELNLTSALTFSGSGITVNGNVTRDSRTQLTANITITSDAAPGARDVNVTNPAGTGTGVGLFTVLGIPTVTGVAPPGANQGDTENVTIAGTNFNGTTTVDFGANITTNTFTIDSNTEITANISIASDAIEGSRNVTVTNAAGSGTGINNFTVKAVNTTLVDRYNSTAVYQDQYDNITAALAGASDNDILIAHAATYNESVTINNAGLTLESLSGAASTIIDATGALVAVRVTVNNVTLDGFTIQGIKTATSEVKGVCIGASGDGYKGCVVTDNIIEGPWSTGDTDTSYGVLAWSSGANTVTNNTINQTYFGIMSKNEFDSTGATHASTVSGNSLNTVCIGIQAVFSDGNTIANNTVTGASFAGVSLYNADSNTVELNTLTNGTTATGVGVRLEGTTDAGNVIRNNTISNNPTGVLVEGIADASNTIHYNNIYNNTNYGINNTQATDVNATLNWWGKIGGPGGVGNGNGDNVSTKVLYDPWLTEQYATVLSSGKCSYGSDNITLQAGWNTLSVPCGLKDSADTFGKIGTMGSYLTNSTGGYWYNATGGNWVLVGDSTTLEPGKGFYIQMSSASTFPVLYDDSLNLPAYGMKAGWNLIGSMFGIDKPGYSVNETATMTANLSLASLGTSAAVVVSPSMPGQNDAWAYSYPEFGTGTMYTGEAYWVYMTADGTLAGFEITPFYF